MDQAPIGYDVFLSHNSQDKPAVRELVSALRGWGLRVWMDEDVLIPGRNWIPLLEQGIQESTAVAICFGPAGLGPWHNEEMQAAVSRAVREGKPAIPVILPGTLETPKLPLFLESRTWVDLRPALTEDNLGKLIWGITGQKPTSEPERRHPVGPISANANNRQDAGAPTISPTRLTPAPAKIFGREAELQRLDEAWANPGVHVLVIQAWGGAGKTTLVAKWMAQLAEGGWRGAERVFDWSFYSQGSREQGGASADSFIYHALIFFGDAPLAKSPASPWDKGARLAQLVAEKPSLLVLDGLEPLQYPPGPTAGGLKDPAVATLLKSLARHNPGLCLVTTREPVADLSTWGSSTAPLWALQALSETAGMALLKYLGVNGPPAEFRRLVQDVHGHALTLHLLGRFLAKAHQGDIRRRDRVNLDKAAGLLRDGHVFHVMDAYERWLSESGDSGARALAVLRLLGLFDRPATQAQLAALRAAPAISGLTEALVDLDEEEWNLALSDLVEIGLLPDGRSGPCPRPEPIGEDQSRARPAPTGDADSIDAHPLIREHFARKLREQASEAWREGHERLYQYLTASVEHRPDRLEELQLLYQAVYHGCQASLVAEACDEVYWDRILRGDEYYSSKKLGAVGADLGAVACFFTQPWRRFLPGLTEANQAWLLNEAASRLRALGRLAEALEPMRSSLDMTVRQETWEYAAVAASNLSELELSLGEIPAALKDAEQSVAYAERSEDMFRHMGSRTTSADAMQQAGKTAAALELFQESERLQAEWQPQNPRLYSLQGFRYCDGLLAEVEREAWRQWLTDATITEAEASLLETCQQVEQRAQQALTIAEDNRWLLAMGLDHLSLGRVALYRALLAQGITVGHPLGRSVALRPPCTEGNVDSAPSNIASTPDHWQDARQHLDAALDFLRRSGMEDEVPRALLTRAWLHTIENQATEAHALLDEAQDIAERGPMRLHLADIHLHRARLFRDPQALAQARELIQQTGYARRLPELADAEKALSRGSAF